jgi:hypothetical protein
MEVVWKKWNTVISQISAFPAQHGPRTGKEFPPGVSDLGLGGFS